MYANVAQRPLMGTSNILQLQENGYKSTVSAISEIIDNSIQANAKNIDIILITNTMSNEIEEILILDDGTGMNYEVFSKALQMSSGTRSNAKAGLGKYGQGLPNSSISQTTRVEVYTREKDGNFLFNYIDLKEIYDNGIALLPDIEEVEKVNLPLFQTGLVDFPQHGTLVRWINPNRVKPKTAKTLVTHIEKIAGRTYRYFLKGFKDKDLNSYKCNINILAYDFNGAIYSKNEFISKCKIKPFDPMFLMDNTQGIRSGTSILYPEPASKTFQVDYDGVLVDSTVELKVSYCPRSIRSEYGRNAGQDEFGKMYLQRNLIGNSGYQNISIIRAGREIDSGNFGFVTDVSSSTERWWSAEIIVDPVIDSIIGIDNKKQQASNIHFIDSNDSESKDKDAHEILNWISTFLSENIKAAKKKLKEEDAQPTTTNPGTESSQPGEKIFGGTEQGTAPPKVTLEDETPQILCELGEWIKQRFPNMTDKEAQAAAEYALSLRDHHIFVLSDLGDTALYSYTVFGNKVIIEINFQHSFYDKFMKKFQDAGDKDSVSAIRLIIGSMVNAEIQLESKEKSILSDRKKIKNRMFETLDDYIEDLFQ